MKPATFFPALLLATSCFAFAATKNEQAKFLHALKSAIQESSKTIGVKKLESISEIRGFGPEYIFSLVGIFNEIQKRSNGRYTFHELSQDVKKQRAELKLKKINYTAEPSSELWVEDSDFSPNPYKILLCESDGDLKLVLYKAEQDAAANP